MKAQRPRYSKASEADYPDRKTPEIKYENAFMSLFANLIHNWKLWRMQRDLERLADIERRKASVLSHLIDRCIMAGQLPAKYSRHRKSEEALNNGSASSEENM